MDIRTLFFFALISIWLTACQNTADETKPPIVDEKQLPEMRYDSVKAKAYGADDYGMKKYVMAFLKRGPNRDQDSITAAQLQTAHMENINSMAEAGQLIIAGPFFGDGDLRGIYIFNVQSIEAAEALTNTDPAIKAGSLEMELLEWYGPAALMALEEIHPTITKSDIVGDN